MYSVQYLLRAYSLWPGGGLGQVKLDAFTVILFSFAPIRRCTLTQGRTFSNTPRGGRGAGLKTTIRYDVSGAAPEGRIPLQRDKPSEFGKIKEKKATALHDYYRKATLEIPGDIISAQ